MQQKHSKIIGNKRFIWFTKRLWTLADGLEVFDAKVSEFAELDLDCWFGTEYEPTLRKVTAHSVKINEASLDHPVILNHDGSLMDGGHRLCKALILGHTTVRAVQFSEIP